MNVYDNLHRFDFCPRLSTQIARVAYLQAINRAKRQQRGRELPLPDELPELSAPEDYLEPALSKKEPADCHIAGVFGGVRGCITVYQLYQGVSHVSGASLSQNDTAI